MANVSGIPVWREIGPSPLNQATGDQARIVVVGGGPVGLTMALDLGRRGHDVVLLNRLDFIPAGSKAICFSKRSLDIFDRLGIGQAMVDKGVVWNVGKVFRGASADPIYRFDLLALKDQKRPAFINLQQYQVEDRLVRALDRLENVDLRWGHEAIAVNPQAAGVEVSVRTAAGDYSLACEWLIACDGSRSPVRTMLGLDFEGQAFEDRFLIADVRMRAERPSERWFWFDPPFNPGRSALLHKQPDDIWRLDFQLGPEASREEATDPAFVEPLIRGMLGQDVAFEPIWYSLYSFQCRRMARFLHGRVVFAGDSAHLVSPFGARGCNGGIADADNLGWKLDLVLRSQAGGQLLESFDEEAIAAADENILNSTRSTNFMTPKTPAERALRDAVLELAVDHPFARPFVNSGRLSTAPCYPGSSLNTPDADDWAGGIPPGHPAPDVPFGEGWLLESLGDGFVLLADDPGEQAPEEVRLIEVGGGGEGMDGLRQRYDFQPGSAYLIRPDQYVAGRWRKPSARQIRDALDRAKGF